MAKMKVDDFIAKALYCEQLSTLYKLGAFMNKKQGKYLLCDCSGLIKGILWGYPGNGKYGSNGVPDINANTMISKCSKVSTNFNKLPLGALVWMNGHIGIHVGNGVCVESSPIWEDGIQCTFIKGSGYSNTRKLHERKWTKWGLFDKYIDYSSTTPKPTPAPSNKISVDGIWGKDTTKLAQKVFKTTIDGIVSNQYYSYKTKNQGLLSSTFEWKNKPGKNGSSLIKAIQKQVGVKADGFIGDSTIGAMQKWLGTVQDGKVSKPSTMVKAFQKWLNSQV
ncbi:MAG: hypothetical protein ACLUVC_16145 [Longibaculum sp.]